MHTSYLETLMIPDSNKFKKQYYYPATTFFWPTILLRKDMFTHSVLLNPVSVSTIYQVDKCKRFRQIRCDHFGDLFTLANTRSINNVVISTLD